MARIPRLSLDDTLENQDWLRRRWTIAPYKSEAFMEWLKSSGMTLEQFRQLPIYMRAVEDGLIVDDQWVGSEDY